MQIRSNLIEILEKLIAYPTVSKESNLELIKFINDLDYRYIRSAFDIIVTGSPYSTFSWCLSANKPLIYFDSKIINPLIDDVVRRKIQKAVFYINIDNYFK